MPRDGFSNYSAHHVPSFSATWRGCHYKLILHEIQNYLTVRYVNYFTDMQNCVTKNKIYGWY